jgi:hypothetical protein
MRLNAWLAPLAGAVGLVSLLTVAPASAATTFLLTGLVEGIDEGDVNAAGTSGRFVVRDRHITGQLSGTIGNQLLSNTAFQFTFRTNVPLTTQSGNLVGTLSFNGYEARVAAKSSLGLTPIACVVGTTGCVPVGGGEGRLPGLLITGTLALINGLTGNGTVEGFVVPILDAEGHIIAAFGQVTLSSK